MEVPNLVVQQFDETAVTVAPGEVPAICFDDRERQRQQHAAMVVNFLRAGCPMVQLIYPRWDLALQQLRGTLHQLRLTGETINLKWIKAADTRGGVVQVTRRRDERASPAPAEPIAAPDRRGV